VNAWLKRRSPEGLKRSPAATLDCGKRSEGKQGEQHGGKAVKNRAFMGEGKG
jgi:hypothetical protein